MTREDDAAAEGYATRDGVADPAGGRDMRKGAPAEA